MTMRLVPLSPELLPFIAVDGRWRGHAGLSENPALARAACATAPWAPDGPPLAFALIDGGLVLAAAGVQPVWPGRGLAWMLPGRWMERRHWGRVLAASERQISVLLAGTFHRIECLVDPLNAAHHAWALRLGFDGEGLLRGVMPDGADHIMMARLAPYPGEA